MDINNTKGTTNVELLQIDTVTGTKEASSNGLSFLYYFHNTGYLPFMLGTVEYDGKTAMMQHYEIGDDDPPYMGFSARLISTPEYYWISVQTPNDGQYYSVELNMTFRIYVFREVTGVNNDS